MTVFEATTSLDPQSVLSRARDFFATRVPATAAFPEQESANHVVLRGGGGEEVVLSAVAIAGGSAVRGSSILFGPQVKRFFTTLPRAAA